jgi:hypothetical protein
MQFGGGILRALPLVKPCIDASAEEDLSGKQAPLRQFLKMPSNQPFEPDVHQSSAELRPKG